MAQKNMELMIRVEFMFLENQNIEERYEDKYRSINFTLI